MAGIYIHIPFCKTHCNYCDFYSVDSTDLFLELVEAICKEIEIRKSYLDSEKISTIYFGGGTPSFISTKDLNKILSKIFEVFTISTKAEITIEVNPDDITESRAKKYIAMGFNRVSIGIQSFSDKYLQFLNRRHNSAQALKSIELLKKAGFSNISIDLIYGIPGLTLKEWESTLEKALSVNVNHISAYHLSYEKGTVLYSLHRKGLIEPITEDESEWSYKILCRILKRNGFDHYEISNFSKTGFQSRHNQSYWENEKYLGLGPSAHSFDQKSRQWNFSDNKKYIAEVARQGKFYNYEKLSKQDRYNEYLLTRLRTKKGISLNSLADLFGEPYFTYFNKQAIRHMRVGDLIHKKDGTVYIPERKWFISDGILADLCRT